VGKITYALKKYLPITTWIGQYNFAKWKGDLNAGLTVGVMLIPQGMAYAMLAGMPPIYGLYAAIIPPCLYAILGTSRHLMLGPTALDSLLIAAGLGALAVEGSAEYIELAILLALLVGLIQLLMGVFKLGFLINFLSRPVISGFTAAAALIISASQLKHLLGLQFDSGHFLHQVLGHTFGHIQELHWPTFWVGLGGILLLLLVKHWRFPIPGPILAVVFGMGIVWGFQLEEQGIRVVGAIPKGLPSLTMPVWDPARIMELLPIAGTIAFISVMESTAIAKAFQFKHNYRIVPDQELIALGLSNIGASFFRGFSFSSSFSRSAVNSQVGGQSAMSGIFAAAFIVLSLFFLTPYLYHLPHTILASIIMVSVLGLIDLKEWRYLWHSNRTDFVMLLITFLGTLGLGIMQGILIGVGLSIGMVIFRTTRPHMAVLGKIPGLDQYKNINRFDQLEVRPDILIIRFDARLYFANVSYFLDTIDDWIEQKGEGLRLLILDAESINDIDSSGIRCLETLVTNTKAKGVRLYFAMVKGPVRDAFNRSGFMQLVGTDSFFFTVQNAVDNYDQKPGNRHLEYATQSNE
ncbi:MAG: sulfate permease, partial [Bacteroidota bacterium]